MAKSSTFRLDVAEFLRETSRLGPAVVGAYVNIMLDYFEQGEAPPDDDSVLARIVGCDPETWKAIRERIAHLFDIADTKMDGKRWFHAHVEAEIDASKRRKAKSAKAAGAAAAVHSKDADAPPTNALGRAYRDLLASGVLTDQEPADIERTGEKEPVLVPRRITEETSSDVMKAVAPMMKPTTLAEDVGAEDDSDEFDEGAPLDVPDPPIPQPVGIAFEGPLPDDFMPTGKWMIDAYSDGYTKEIVADVLDSFRRYHSAAGTTSNNWPANWDNWWNRKKPPLHPAEKKARPRVEVSRRAPPPPQNS